MFGVGGVYGYKIIFLSLFFSLSLLVWFGGWISPLSLVFPFLKLGMGVVCM